MVKVGLKKKLNNVNFQESGLFELVDDWSKRDRFFLLVGLDFYYFLVLIWLWVVG